MSTITPQPNTSLIPSDSAANLLTVDESLRDAELEEVLDDLSSRFILNMPEPELSSTERISFQIEQAHWYYEDFVRPLNPIFPSMSLKRFSAILFKACPLLSEFSHEQAFEDFQKYKSRVPVCGAILMNSKMDKCVLVKGWKSTSAWSFPKGKINQDESRAACAIREVREETGYDYAAAGLLDKNAKTTIEINEQSLTLYFVAGVPENTVFETQTRKEISKIEWFAMADLPTWSKKKVKEQGKFYLVSPFISALRAFIHAKKAAQRTNGVQPEIPTHGESDRSSSLGPVTPPGAIVAPMSQAIPQPMAAGTSFLGPKPDGLEESDSERMSRLFSALSTSSSSTVATAVPQLPPSVPLPGLSPSSPSSDRTDKHIALLDSLLGSNSGMSPAPSAQSTSRKVSESRPLPPIPSGSRAFPSNGPAGQPFPIVAHPPPMAPAPPPMHAPPPIPYQMEAAHGYTSPGPPPPQQQSSQPPLYLHTPQATYPYYPPAAYGSDQPPAGPDAAHKGALLSLLSPNGFPPPPLPGPGQNSLYPSAPPMFDPRAGLGVAGGFGVGPSLPPRMAPPSMNGPFHDPGYNPMPMPPPANMHNGGMPTPPFNMRNNGVPTPPFNMGNNGVPTPPYNMGNNGVPTPPFNMGNNGMPRPPFPPTAAAYGPSPNLAAAPMRQPFDAPPAAPHHLPPRMLARPPLDFPYAGPSPDVSVDAFFPKGLPKPQRASPSQLMYRQPPGAPAGLDMPKPRQPESLLAILNSGPRPHL